MKSWFNMCFRFEDKKIPQVNVNRQLSSVFFYEISKYSQNDLVTKVIL
jgi:hypothetical protein